MSAGRMWEVCGGSGGFREGWLVTLSLWREGAVPVSTVFGRQLWELFTWGAMERSGTGLLKGSAWCGVLCVAFFKAPGEARRRSFFLIQISAGQSQKSSSEEGLGLTGSSHPHPSLVLCYRHRIRAAAHPCMCLWSLCSSCHSWW